MSSVFVVAFTCYLRILKSASITYNFIIFDCIFKSMTCSYSFKIEPIKIILGNELFHITIFKLFENIL